MRIRCAFVLQALIIAPIAGAAMPAAAPEPDRALAAYAEPATRVDIGGRKLNLRCTGSGDAPASTAMRSS